MTIYTVEHNGQTLDVEGPDNASESELQAYVESQGTQTPETPKAPLESKPTASKSDLEAAKNVFSAFRQGSPTPGVGQDIDQVASLPFRGLRAIGTLGEGVPRAAEAVSPDFVPVTGPEKLANASSKLAEFAMMLGPGRATKLGRAATELSSLNKAKSVMEALKTGAGINTEAAISAIKNPEVAATVVTKLNNLKKLGALKRLGPQGLHEAEVITRNLLNAEKVGPVARILGGKPAGVLTDQGVALAARGKEGVISAQNELIPGLEKAREVVGDVYLRNKIAKRAAILAALGVAKSKLFGPATPLVQEAVR